MIVNVFVHKYISSYLYSAYVQNKTWMIVESDEEVSIGMDSEVPKACQNWDHTSFCHIMKGTKMQE